MPSAIDEEPRYNSLDTQQRPTCSNPSADVSSDDDLNVDNDLEPQIDINGDLSTHSLGYTNSDSGPSPVHDAVILNSANVSDGQPNMLIHERDIGIPGASDDTTNNQHEFQEHVITNNLGSSTNTIALNNYHDSNHDNNNNHNRYHQASGPSISPLKVVLKGIVTRISKVFANTSLGTDRCLREEQPNSAFANRRALEKTWKLMDKVVKCCQHPLMGLNNSPPFILDILPETYKHLKLIHTKHDSQPINDNEYSQIFLRNLANRCELTLKLFKNAKDVIYNGESEYRHKLTRNTLVFNHILSELKTIYPNGSFIGDRFLITKRESAGEFWRQSFGDNIVVDWKTFYHALQQVHKIDSSFFSLNALKQTIDLTCDDHISIFEFDVFTRLFQPWSTLLKNWQTLAVTHPGYKAFLTYDELKARLQKHIHKPGSYVFRLSCTKLGQWAIGYVTRDGQILQTIVQNISLSQALTETGFCIYSDGKEEDPDLRERLRSGMIDDERNVTVTEEQYEIYCGLGNSFQTCKICFVNDKEIRVEPCNHLLCTSCLSAWQESEGQGCPYCRTEIKETVQITMDLPQKSGRNG